MADDFTQLNPGSGGDFMDESSVDYPVLPTPRKRARVVLTGDGGKDELARITDTQPDQNDYGLVVRPIVASLPPQQQLTLYGEVMLVNANIFTTLVTYTVPDGQTFYFTGYVAGGDLPARFRITREGTPCLVQRSNVADPDVDLIFNIAPFSVPGLNTIALEVIHSQDGLQGSFDGTLLGYTI